MSCLRFTIGAKNVNDLMGNHILNSLAGRFQILAGIEVIRMLCEIFTDITCHSKADIGVDIDLT